MENTTRRVIFKEEAMVHFAQIYRVALRMTRKKEDAEELAQNTFMRAWKSFDKYEPGTNCRAWLYQILINNNNATRRKRFVQSSHIQDVDEFVLENAIQPGAITEHLTDETVIRGLKELPDYFRSVVYMTDVYGYHYKEVSNLLGIPIGTVMSRLNRARTALRSRLADAALERGIISPSHSV